MAEHVPPVTSEGGKYDTKIVQSDHFPSSPFDYEDGRTVLGLKDGESDEFALYMQMNRPSEYRRSNPGIDSVPAMEEMLTGDGYDGQLEKIRDDKDLDEHVTPTAQEIDELVDELEEEIGEYEDSIGYWPRFTALMNVWDEFEERAQELERDRIK